MNIKRTFQAVLFVAAIAMAMNEGTASYINLFGLGAVCLWAAWVMKG